MKNLEKQNQRQERWKGKKNTLENLYPWHKHFDATIYICNGRLNWVSTSDESS
jgi:hypothetical protein